MALTEEQREKRKRFIGSSDISAIIGTDSYRNAGDVWLSKTGRLPAFEGNETTRRGVVLEPYILNLFEAEHGVTLARDVWVQGDDCCAANLDGAMVEYQRPPVVAQSEHGMVYQTSPLDIDRVIAPVEAKTSNLGRDWNQETGEVPLNVLVQVSFQIFCSGPQCTHGFVPALIPEFQRFKFVSPIVKRNDELIEQLVIAAHEFMDYVKRDERPPDAVPHLESLKRIRREPDSIVSLGDEAAEIWSNLESAKERAKSAAADESEYKRQILAILGDNEGGRLIDGRLISFLEQSGGRHCDVDQLRVLSPELYERTVTQGRHRVLRIKKAKIGKSK